MGWFGYNNPHSGHGTMNENTIPEELLTPILINPYDDAPRLILADYLEEQGFMERAEFIRVQIDLANLLPRVLDRVQGKTTGPIPDPLVTRHAELRTKEQELWKILLLGDSFYVGNLTPGLSWEHRPAEMAMVSRGFVAHIRCTLADWYGGGWCQCGGTGLVLENHDGVAGYTCCPTCSGTGRIGGHGPEIVRQHPVTRVELSDRWPGGSPVAARWIEEFARWEEGHNPMFYELPRGVFDSLPISPTCLPIQNIDTYASRAYESPNAACNALSIALINWARRKAELPEL